MNAVDLLTAEIAREHGLKAQAESGRGKEF